MFFSSKNCSSVISCWVNKERLSVKQPYCMNCHKWNCSELTMTIDHTFICLFWSCFSSFPLVLALMLCNIYSAQILKSVTLLSIFARRNVKAMKKLNNNNWANFEMRDCLIQSWFQWMTSTISVKDLFWFCLLPCRHFCSKSSSLSLTFRLKLGNNHAWYPRKV